MSKVHEELKPEDYGSQDNQEDCCSDCDHWDKVLQEETASATRLPDPGSESLDGWFTPSGGDATKG